MMRRERRPSGFTLVEMMVVMVIMSMLAAIAVPAMSAARETAHSMCCKNNLRQFGVGMFASASRSGAYCTGAFDWRRDGSISEIGWVADLVQDGVSVGDMLCPSNPAQISETLQDLLTLTTFSCNVDGAGQSSGSAPDGSIIVNPCRKILGAYPGGSALAVNSEARRKVVEQLALQVGLNTNYAASWFLVRSGVVLDGDGNLSTPAGCTASPRERSCTQGPLKEVQVENAGPRMATIPFLGCANWTGTYLTQPLGNNSAGSPLAASFTAGPVLKTTMTAPTFGSGTSSSGAGGSWGTWNNQTLQDYRNFGPFHRGSCNLLFADGGVRAVVDVNHDGFLNNGFPATLTNGFQDSNVEITSQQIRNGWDLRSQF